MYVQNKTTLEQKINNGLQTTIFSNPLNQKPKLVVCPALTVCFRDEYYWQVYLKTSGCAGEPLKKPWQPHTALWQAFSGKMSSIFPAGEYTLLAEKQRVCMWDELLQCANIAIRNTRHWNYTLLQWKHSIFMCIGCVWATYFRLGKAITCDVWGTNVSERCFYLRCKKQIKTTDLTQIDCRQFKVRCLEINSLYM